MIRVRDGVGPGQFRILKRLKWEPEWGKDTPRPSVRSIFSTTSHHDAGDSCSTLPPPYNNTTYASLYDRQTNVLSRSLSRAVAVEQPRSSREHRTRNIIAFTPVFRDTVQHQARPREISQQSTVTTTNG